MMAPPRITFVLSRQDGEDEPSIYLYLNEEGRDRLVRELQQLDRRSDHVHLQNEDWTIDVPLQSIAYDPKTETAVDNVKIMLRPDDWDAKYYPHVMNGEGN